MSKRKSPDAPFSPPRSTKECQDSTERSITLKDMEHVIDLLEDIRDSIGLLQSIVLKDQLDASTDEEES